MPAPAGIEIIRGELESNVFQKLGMTSDNGKAFLCEGQISENGNKIEDEIGARPDIKNGAINIYVGTGKIEKRAISNMILNEKAGKP
jgi:hypothetical protein